ncbi:alpha/beta fold hydrolase [uncultured Jannaschia sp.]|uniref:alpha/beta hydrolase n=1 Tax=uncultured Jannaschia sp. TaxID=293347 RepID=UPI002638B635|nr:alpha/beta fold hydrolase [uncultured Jannaschia sp.]
MPLPDRDCPRLRRRTGSIGLERAGQRRMNHGGRTIRLTFFLSLSLALAGCAGRPGPQTVWPVADSAAAGQRQKIFVTTTRSRAEVAADGYTDGRSPSTNFAEFEVSIPPDHVPGAIEWSEGRPDPHSDFAVANHLRVDEATFFARLDRMDDQGVGVFVHGFNYNFPEALFRLAQMTADVQLEGTPVLFTWPSSASLLGYAYDKESASYSRDALAGLLTKLAKSTSSEPVTVFGHSMGGWLVMEVLRQMRIAGEDEALTRLEVVLAAPDIDVDLFRQQLAVIGKMDIPMVLMVSSDDRALQLSSAIAGQKPRVGALSLSDPAVQAAAKASNVVLLDISSIDATSGMNHDRYIGLAAAYPSLVDEMQSEQPLRDAGTYIIDAAGQVLTAPLRVVGAAISE